MGSQRISSKLYTLGKLYNWIRMGSKNGKPVLTEDQAEALTQSSGLTVDQVKEQFEAFKTEHPNGKMKRKDFKEMMSKALPKKDANKMEKHVFRIYVSNDDGYIDFVEFMVIFYIMAEGSAEEVLGKIFRVFDVNSDGNISNKEMKRLVKDMYGLLKAEDANVAADKMIAKSAFAEMDKNEDGKVSLEEFKSACLGREEFSKMLAVKVIDIFVDDE